MPHAGYSGPQGKYRPQFQTILDRGIVAAHAVQCNSRSGVGARLGRQVPDAIAGLNVNRAGVKVLFPYPIDGIIERLQLFRRIGSVAVRLPIGDAEMGKNACNM